MNLKKDNSTSPCVWLLFGEKRGDNAQLETLEKALGWRCNRKQIHVREPYIVGKPRVRPSLHHIDMERSDPLDPPWPDIAITIGRRPSMVALWLRERSGGDTKIVLLGKPSGLMNQFDLVISSAEIQLFPLPNVLPITLPLMDVSEGAIDNAVQKWKSSLDTLPRPLIGILVGGPTIPFVFDVSVADRLVEVANSIARDMGGTPYITTSRRTPPDLVHALTARLPAGARLFTWVPDSDENPYLGLLGLGDGFIVTGDSISMMVEVIRRRKSLVIFELPYGWIGSIDQARRSIARTLFSPATDSFTDRLRRHLATTVYRLRLLRHTRNFSGMHQLLIDQGLAVRVGNGFPPPQGQVPNDLPLVINRIKALVTKQ